MAGERTLLVARLLSEMDQHRAGFDTAARGVGAFDGGPVALERERERLRVVEPPSDLHRLLGHPNPSGARWVVADRCREAGEQLHPLGAVGLTDRCKGALEERDQERVGARARPREPSAVLDRRASEPVRPAGPLGKRRGPPEHFLGFLAASGAAQRLAERELELAGPVGVARSGRVERMERPRVVANRFLVSEL